MTEMYMTWIIYNPTLYTGETYMDEIWTAVRVLASRNQPITNITMYIAVYITYNFVNCPLTAKTCINVLSSAKQRSQCWLLFLLQTLYIDDNNS